MLEEFLKTSNPYLSASWEEAAHGVKVCRFVQDPFSGEFPIEVPVRSQKDHFEVFFCESGTLLLDRQKKGMLSVKGQDVLLLSDCPEIRRAQIAVELSGILIHVEGLDAFNEFRMIYNLPDELSLYGKAVHAGMKEQDGCVVLQNDPWSHSVFTMLQTMPGERQGLYCALRYIELLYLLGTDSLFLREQSDLQIAGSYLARTITEMRVYMESHLDEKLTIDTMSQQFHISPTAFKSCFRQMYGTSIHRWLQLCRIERAAELLRTTPMEILLIAQAVGYEGLSQFNVVFKRHFGMTPRQYRKLSNTIIS